MRRIEKPTEDVGVVFMKCISLVRDLDLKKRLTQCKDVIIEASEDFEEKATETLSHTIVVSDNVGGIVSRGRDVSSLQWKNGKKGFPWQTDL